MSKGWVAIAFTHLRSRDKTMENLSIIIMLGGMFLFLLLGCHVMVGLGLAGVFGLYLLFHGDFSLIETTLWNVMNNPVMLVIPLFVFMGEMLLSAGLSKKLFDGAESFTGWLPGGLCHVNVFSSAIFAAISGSSVATLAAIGTVSLPEGDKRNYSRSLFLGSLAGGATLGILIPPSCIMIVYGVLAEESIGKLFMGGMIPGIIAAALFMLYIVVHVSRNPSLAPKEHAFSFKRMAHGAVDILPTLLLVVTVLGSIYTGFSTPNEAAAIGCTGALILTLTYRAFSWKGLKQAFETSAETTAMVMFLMLGATMISNVLGHSGLTAEMVEAVVALGLSPYLFFAFVCILYVIMGMLFDSFSVMVLTIPLIYPIAMTLGFNGIWFGIQITILCEAGLITPPFGINLFVLDGMTGGGNFPRIAKGCIPFVILLLVVISVVTLCPQLVLWLPSMMAG